MSASLVALWKEPAVRTELVELLGVFDDRSEALARPLGLAPHIPLSVHSRYTRDEVLTALGEGSPEHPLQLREGVRWVEEEAVDLLFVTLNKSENDYSPTTMYRNDAVAPDLFHWESQSTTRETSPTGRRYVGHASAGSSVLLFVRDRAKSPTGATSPYWCLGLATHLDHKGSVRWRSIESCAAMPEALFEAARAVAA